MWTPPRRLAFGRSAGCAPLRQYHQQPPDQYEPRRADREQHRARARDGQTSTSRTGRVADGHDIAAVRTAAGRRGHHTTGVAAPGVLAAAAVAAAGRQARLGVQDADAQIEDGLLRTAVPVAALGAGEDLYPQRGAVALGLLIGDLPDQVAERQPYRRPVHGGGGFV